MPVTNSLDEDKEQYGTSEVDDESEYIDYMRFPRLYRYAVDDDATGGITPLPDCISCNVVWNANQFPTLQMTYPIKGIGADLIQREYIIMADMGPNFLHQKFRIHQITRSDKNIIVNAVHIIGDLVGDPIKADINIPSLTPTDLFNTILDNLDQPKPDIRFDSDIDTMADPNMPMADSDAGNLLIAPDKEGDASTQSIIGLYGGELIFDNYQIFHRRKAGRNSGMVVKYGRNLRTVQQDENIDSAITGVYFYATYTPGQAKATQDNVDWADWRVYASNYGSVTFAAGGSIDIYDSPVAGHHVLRTVENGEKLVLGDIVQNGQMIPNPSHPDSTLEIDTVNGDSWYPTTEGGWIDSQWINFDKSGDYIVNDAEGHVTVDVNGTNVKGTRYPVDGTAVVTYNGPSNIIHVYYSPDQGVGHYRIEGKSLQNGETVRFNYVAIDENGHKWYHIGPHEWVYGPHLSLNKYGAVASYPSHGEGYIKQNAQKYYFDTNHNEIVADKQHTKWVSTRTKKTNKYKTKVVYRGHGKHRKKEKIKVINPTYTGHRKKKVKTTIDKGYYNLNKGQMVIGGTTYYRISSGAWVKSSDIDWKKAKSRKPDGPTKILAGNADNNGKVEVHSKPTKASAVNWSVKDGAGYTVVSTAKGDGIDWYEIEYQPGKYGFIPAEQTNTKGDIDDAPHAPRDDSDTNDDTTSITDTQVKVTLPEGTLYSDDCYNEETARIKNVDLSSYFKHDDQDVSGQQPDGTFQMTEADVEQLRQLGKSWMEEYKVGEIPIQLTVSYQQLDGVEGDLTALNLYDTVAVEFDELGIQQNAEVNSTTFNCLTHKYESITIGKLPETYDHLMLQAANKSATKLHQQSKSQIDHTMDLTAQVHNALQLEGSDRKAAEMKIAKDLGIVSNKTQTLEVTQKAFDQSLQTYDQNQQEIKSWVESGGSQVLQFLDASGKQTYVNPTTIRARTDNGGWMLFNSDGLIYEDGAGTLKTGIDSQGMIHAENINAGEIYSLHANDLVVNGSLIAQVGGYEITVGAYNDQANAYLGGTDTSRGISVGTQNFSCVIGSGSIKMGGSSGQLADYQPSAIELDAANGNSIFINATYKEISTNTSTFLKTTDTDPSIQNWVKRHWNGPSKDWDF